MSTLHNPHSNSGTPMQCMHDMTLVFMHDNCDHIILATKLANNNSLPPKRHFSLFPLIPPPLPSYTHMITGVSGLVLRERYPSVTSSWQASEHCIVQVRAWSNFVVIIPTVISFLFKIFFNLPYIIINTPHLTVLQSHHDHTTRHVHSQTTTCHHLVRTCISISHPFSILYL